MNHKSFFFLIIIFTIFLIGCTKIPSSYQIKNVNLFTGGCYPSSAKMVLDYQGYDVTDLDKYIESKKTNSLLDFFLIFKYPPLIKANLNTKIHLAYSNKYNHKYATSFNQYLKNPDKQRLLFNTKEQAFDHLKKKISSDIPVIVIIHHGWHYVVATGYDDIYIYLNDPDPDPVPGEDNSKMKIEQFLYEWDLTEQEIFFDEYGQGQERVGFPGDYGMMWFE